MHVEDKSKAFRQVVRKDQLAKLEEVRTAPEQWTPQNFVGRRRLMNPIRRNPELKSEMNVYSPELENTCRLCVCLEEFVQSYAMNHHSPGIFRTFLISTEQQTLHR